MRYKRVVLLSLVSNLGVLEQVVKIVPFGAI